MSYSPCQLLFCSDLKLGLDLEGLGQVQVGNLGFAFCLERRTVT